MAREIITLSFPSRLELLGMLDKMLEGLSEQMQLDEDTAAAVTISSIEAATNAIQHGHKRDAARPVDIQFLLYADRIEVAVRDSGSGFDPSAVNGDITSIDHLLEARGRGIFIMRACMDSVAFDFSQGGTVCHLVKRRPPPSPQG